MKTKTEQEVLQDLLSWSRRHLSPVFVKRYIENPDRRAAARDLLRMRIEEDPGCLFDLPISVIEKLEYAITREVEPDQSLVDLCKAARVKISHMISLEK